jgi:hypothetical protein
MNSRIKLAVAGALTLASASAFAVNLPTTGNGSAVLTLFSTDDTTPFSYTFDLGINFNDVLANYSTPGFTKSFSLTGLAADLAANPAAQANLVFDVTSASTTGSVATVGGFKLITTFDPATTSAAIGAITTGALSQANGHNNTFLTNFGATNPSFTTNPADTNYANANYNTVLNTFPTGTNVAASTSSALPFYELVSAKGTTTLATSTNLGGTWTINLSTDMLTYTVPGGSVPLPASVWLLISGLAGMFVLGRRRKDDAGFEATPA